MARAKKFSTFGGVFVPSVLTILGVIMYLRLGWVVGNAGLIGTIIIILIAHLISVSTGLSVSSIATDKKVQAGGIYYMLSRSLGLPIGGAIGIALFIATALSIAMYIVGFAESFNNALGLTYPDMDSLARSNSLRITGTVTLAIISTVALISTSLAIKTQYYIFGAILLSLVSIFAGGLFLDHGLTPAVRPLFSPQDSVSMETVFAIFFPAVTGFTAGVAMSGDLKDPKKSIPIGTMASIGVGLVVYISLAVFLSSTVDSQILREDTNILARIALFSAFGAPFLMAGIWGATLSSALGGILGGPRILQAMSLDQVTPKVFGKGVGKSNEPRNALICAFIIAEAGVLIGELDLIAPIVSMFYLTAYGFINLTCTLESWSGSDFRPTFKIPRAVSLLGALATFAVMFKLDMIAMFAAFIIIGLIFLYLTRKQINLGYSDVWLGVWSEVARVALGRMRRHTPDKGSWRPNILLFSGGTEKRLHLLEYGKRLVGGLGLLSNFDLIEDPSEKALFAKRDQAITDTAQGQGVFTRKYVCSDVYSGLERIAETYGFSGLDPNTILMGWARYTRHPVRFGQLINKFQKLDYSLLIMDYDQQVGFGGKRKIDIWWEGTSRHLSLVLTISRFLHTADDWQKATVRLIVLADTSQVDDMVIHKKLEHVQEEFRIAFEVKIINSALVQRPIYEIVQYESAGADLVYLELPDLKEGNERQFFTETDALCKEIGTVILYRASKEFEVIDLGIGKSKFKLTDTHNISEPDLKSLPLDYPLLEPPEHPVMRENFQAFNHAVQEFIQDYYKDFLIPYARANHQLVQSIQKLSKGFYEQLKPKSPENNDQTELAENHVERELFSGVLQLVEDFQSNQLNSQEQLLVSAVDQATEKSSQIIAKCPQQLLIEFDRDTLSKQELKNFSWLQRIKSRFNRSPLKYQVRFQKMAEVQFQHQMQNALLEIQQQINQHSTQFGNDLRKYLRRMAAGIRKLKSSENGVSELLNDETEQINKRWTDLKSQTGIQILAYRDYLLKDSLVRLQQFAEYANHIEINKALQSKPRQQRQWAKMTAHMKETVEAWAYNQSLDFNLSQLEIKLLLVRIELEDFAEKFIKNLHGIPQKRLFQKTERLISSLKRLVEQCKEGKYLKLTATHEMADFSELTENAEDFIAVSKEVTGELPKKMLVPNLQTGYTDLSEEVETIEISPREIVNYLVQSNLIVPLESRMQGINTTLSKADHTILDVLQVVNLALDRSDDDPEPEEYGQKLINNVNEEISRLKESIQQVEGIIHQQATELTENVKLISQNLNSHAIIKAALDFDYYMMTRKQTQVINRFTGASQSIKNYITSGLTKLYYRRSEGLIAAKRFKGYHDDFATWTTGMSKLVNEITPDVQVLKELPFYYRQLFLRSHSVGKDLWLIRSKSTRQAEESVSYYRRVRSGGLLILGAPLSGKTYFSEFIADRHFEEDKVFSITPPEEGSIDRNVFFRSIKKGLKYYGEIASAFDNLGQDSVLIFNDVEKWWERSEQGFAVLDSLIGLIEAYGQKSLFIVNMNQQSFQLINNIRKIEESFFVILKTIPFNAEELKQVILSRHKTSRLKFILDGKHEDTISEWQLAKLFTRYFDLSDGNVGVALQQWICSIEGISEKGEIEIRHPKQPDQDILSDIDKDRVIILIQFILHRSLNRERLLRILRTSPDELDKQLTILRRLDLLQEKNGVWEINRFLQPFLIAAFQEDLLI